MGEWEVDTALRCVDCGGTIRETKATGRAQYYRVQRSEHVMAILCPACWTTQRIHPSVTKRSALLGS